MADVAQQRSTGKNLVVFCDGTDDQFGQDNTNVVKLLSSAVRQADSQVAFYDPGVGTFPAPGAWTPIAQWWTKLLGEMVGYGLTQNVATCYDFLMRNYVDGDRIYIFGFSRGAYTARVLAALIHACGLLRTYNPNLTTYAINLFRAEAIGAKKKNDRDEARTQQFVPLRLPMCDHFKAVFSVEPTVHFIGVWDTVASVGSIFNPFKLPFTHWNPSVLNVRHAISIDERRKFFRPNLWSEHQDGCAVKQIWFAGVHGDVGGGYPESQSGLAKIALRWMMQEAQACGLELDLERQRAILGRGSNEVPPNPYGPMHDELKKPMWKFAQWIPRRMSRRNPATHRYESYWNFSPVQQPRLIEAGSVIHSSVFERIARPDMHYEPPNLPAYAYDENGHRHPPAT